MDFIDEKLLEYCEKFSQPESALLQELNRETHLKVNSPRMLSGHLQGRFLNFMSQLARPSTILEIGTYTGYSALCLAEGLADNGKLITIDPNEETNHFAQKFIDRSPLRDKILIMSGDARRIIPELDEVFDLVFIDADKQNYLNYYNLIIEKVRKGGLILADNTLWDGKVIAEKKDTDTIAIHEFNTRVAADSRVTVVLLPVRDGISLIMKK
jgi:caffeoyl-CoA O-methyltransferase